jgi:hypothetical protein
LTGRALVLLAFLSCAAHGQDRKPESVPPGIRGTWTVVANLSEHTLGCFDAPDAEALVGMRVLIGPAQLHWRRFNSDHLDPQVNVLSSYAFLYRYGKLPEELGLSPSPVTIVDVHPSQGIPVNALVQVDRSTILIDACNIWLKATREDPTAPAPTPPR